MPNSLNQRTVKNTIKATGVGLHSGKEVCLTLKPAPVDTGIIFQRTDLEPTFSVEAKAEYVGATMLGTSLIKDDTHIATVEHLLSALAGVGIDNLYVEVDSPEIPIMDGSSAPFVFLIESAGIEIQEAKKRFIRIKEKVYVEMDDDKTQDKKWASFEPYEGFKLDFTIDFQHPVINNTAQHMVLDFSTTSYIKEISRARTFGFMKEYEYLKARQLAQGASLDNTIAVGDEGVLNEGGLRYDDEFVKHKVLDCIGDVYLAGASIIGEFKGHKSGHSLNNQLVRKLLADPTAFEFVTFDDVADAPRCYRAQVVEEASSAAES